MQLRTILATVLLSCLVVVAAHPAFAAPAAIKYTLVMVGDGKPAMRAMEDQVLGQLADLRTRQGLSKGVLPILTYHLNNPSERAYCEKNLGIKEGDLFFLGVGQYVVQNGAFNVTKLIFSERNVINPRRAALEMFAQTMGKLNLKLSEKIKLQADLSRSFNALMSQVSLNNKKVAVGQPVDGTGRISQLSPYIADSLEAALLDHKNDLHCQVVRKNNLQDLVADWNLGTQGLIDPSTSKAASSILGVDVFCFTNYKLNDDMLTAKISLLKPDGALLASASQDFKLDQTLQRMAQQYLQNGAQTQVVANTGDPLQLRITTDKNAYKVGDKVVVSLTANQDCYVTLIDVGTSGKASIIFPNHYTSDNFVKAGVTYTIPDPRAGFEYELAGPPGAEIIRGIASKTPNIDLTQIMSPSSASSPFGSVKQDLTVLSRDIRVKSKGAKAGTWSEATSRVEIGK